MKQVGDYPRPVSLLELRVAIVFHPFVVHFPVALLLLNWALTFAAIRRHDPFIERTAYGALVIGWWGAFAAIVTGTLDLALRWPLQPQYVFWINLHAALSFVVLLVYGQALLRRRRDRQILYGANRRSYLALLSVGVALVLATGWVGGHLVYGLGFAVR